jgi:surface polysaccharide O-acyltransferase-like enzyme
MGLAIFAVVLSHAAGWGQIAMVNWTDRYRPVTVPNFDAVGSLPWDIIVFIRQVAVWAVPAFLFCSGFFVAYAARGSRSVYNWKMARSRVTDLLIPYALWSVIWFVADALEHKTYAPGEYVSRFITGKADGGSYFFIPMLCQFYLLSPLMVPMAKTRPKQLIATAAVIQLIGFAVQYLNVLDVATPPYISWIIQPWLFFMWTTYFALGLTCGFHSERVKQAVLRHKRILIGALLLFGAISIFEAEGIFWATGMRSDARYVPYTLSAWMFSIAFILAFLVFDKISVPLPAQVNQLGSKSYGIYLLHLRAMDYVARIIRQIAPRLLSYSVLVFSPLMLIVGLGLPFLLMRLASKLPTRKHYHHLFG